MSADSIKIGIFHFTNKIEKICFTLVIQRRLQMQKFHFLPKKKKRNT